MFQGLVALLFPVYIVGCLLAVFLSWSKQSFLVSASYAYILITFQFFITGRAQEFGINTFLYCAYAQIFMGLCAIFLGNRTVPLGSIAACLVNMIEALAYALDHPFRDFYFVSINTIQTYQILSLIALSPGMIKLYRFIPKGKERWKAHQMEMA